MSDIKILNQIISKSSKPFIIAEAGINHNGEIDKAFEMIEAAKKADVNAIKFQTFKAEEFVGDSSQTYTYLSQGKEVTESMLEMFKRHEFSRDEWFLIKKKCDEEGILFLSTPQNYSDLELLLEMGIPAIKVGSDDFTNLSLLKNYSKTGLPMLVSCGMADLGEVYQALEAIGTFDGHPTVLFLCTSQYPTPPEDVNLNKLKTLSRAFPDLILGFSDHTQGFLAASVAVGLGATVFEKHFTLDNNLPGPDHWFSANPSQLQEWINSIKTTYNMLGSHIIRPTNTELINKKEFQRVIVAAKDIQQGDIFTEDSFMMRRVSLGNGYPYKYIEFLTGKFAKRDFIKGEPIFL
ncbi:MAG: hypothetical protein ACD_20C00429G0017 [uncultured bacterium]|nr:MAG: hypothetical protein ACD_20C00429G0017 [uncultured bacterium]